MGYLNEKKRRDLLPWLLNRVRSKIFLDGRLVRSPMAAKAGLLSNSLRPTLARSAPVTASMG